MIDSMPIDDNRRTLARRHRASPINIFEKARFTVNRCQAIDEYKY